MIDLALLGLFIGFLLWPVSALPLFYKAYGKMGVFFGFLLWIALMAAYFDAYRMALHASKKLQPSNNIATSIGQMSISLEVLLVGVATAIIFGLVLIIVKKKYDANVILLEKKAKNDKEIPSPGSDCR